MGDSSRICKEVWLVFHGVVHEGALLSNCPLSSAVCNATIPTSPLFEMVESACLPFHYVLHYFVFILAFSMYA
jgi:hypothetical protein